MAYVSGFGGHATYRVEFKYPDESIAHQWERQIDSDQMTEVELLFPGNLPGCKLLNIVIEGKDNATADLAVDKIEFVCDVPGHLKDPILYGIVSAYCQMLRAFDESTNMTADHYHFRRGDFQSTPASGMQALCAAAAYHVGIISLESARDMAEKSAAALLALPRESRTGLLPHWTQNGQRHRDSEWPTIDSGMATLATILGLHSLGMTELEQRILNEIVFNINYAELIAPDGTLIHGLNANGNPLAFTWQYRDGEQLIAAAPRALKEPGAVPLSSDVVPEVYGGVGFIDELLGIFGLAGPGADRTGIDWHARRVSHMEAQVAFARSLARTILIGLSESEVRDDNGRTAFLAGGIGSSTPAVDARYTVQGFGDDPWFAVYYMSMVAVLDTRAAEQRIQLLIDEGAWPILVGPAESVQVKPDGSIARIHRAQISLHSGFHVLGLYHALVSRGAYSNTIHDSVSGSVVAGVVNDIFAN